MSEANATIGPEGEPDAEAETRGMLNQAEIDSLMRFDEPVRTGMERLIRSGLISYERLPMLEIIFDRLVRILSTSLRNFTSDNAEATIESISSFRLGDYLATLPVHSILAVFRAEEWDNSGLLCLDSSMIYNMIDLVLGGRHGGGPDAAGKPALHAHRARAGRAPGQCHSGGFHHQLHPGLKGPFPV